MSMTSVDASYHGASHSTTPLDTVRCESRGHDQIKIPSLQIAIQRDTRAVPQMKLGLIACNEVRQVGQQK